MPKKSVSKRTVTPQYELPADWREQLARESSPPYAIPENPSDAQYQRLMEYEMDRMGDKED